MTATTATITSLPTAPAYHVVSTSGSYGNVEYFCDVCDETVPWAFAYGHSLLKTTTEQRVAFVERCERLAAMLAEAMR